MEEEREGTRKERWEWKREEKEKRKEGVLIYLKF